MIIETPRIPASRWDGQLQDAVHRFQTILANAQGVDVSVRAEPFLPRQAGFVLCFRGSWCYPDGLPYFQLWQHEIGYLANCARLGQVYIERTGTSITFWRDPRTALPSFVDYFLNTILAIVLELQGVLCLHASSVTIGAHTIAFLGDSGAGKSSLAAEFLAAGATLLADDITPVLPQPDAHGIVPMRPQLKLHPEVAKRALSSEIRKSLSIAADKKYWIPVGQNQCPWSPHVNRLSALYILEPHNNTNPESANITSQRLSGHMSSFALMRHSYVAPLVSVLGLQQSWLNRLINLASALPIRRLRYGHGLHQLPHMRGTIMQALEA